VLPKQRMANVGIVTAARFREVRAFANRRTHEVKVVHLRTEYGENPLGIDTTQPRLSWQLQSAARGTAQTAYQIRVFRGERDEDLVWDTGKVPSAQSILVPYAGAPLQSRQRYHWQARIWDERGIATPYSEPAWWEMGLLSDLDWQAQWIAPPIDGDVDRSTPSPLLRSTFMVDGVVAKARAYVTALGLYELHLNGQRVGDALFTPGWTCFEKRLQYQVYDVTALLQVGANAVGAVLGDGWYRWAASAGNMHRNNGKARALLLQIEILYADGRTQTIVSNEDWRTETGPILRSEIYNGEIYDARLERDGWATAQYDDSEWSRVRRMERPPAVLVATMAPAVRRIEEIRPSRIFKSPAGVTLVDMGQNIAGWVRLRVRGAAGTRIRLRHAEVLDGDGELYTANLRRAEQTVEYILRGRGEEVYEPHFTFHGFRYVAIEGYPGALSADDLTGVVVHSDLERTGRLETSSEPINRLLHNILWSQKANYFDVPIDCPQRDERQGWTADAAQFLPSAAYNMNVAAFFTKWLADLAADQTEEGVVPSETPRVRTRKFTLSEIYPVLGREGDDPRVVEWANQPAYGDAATSVPWNLYLAYGDERILASQYDSMKRWVEHVRAEAGSDHIWNPAFNLGDWLDYATTQQSTLLPDTNPGDLLATAYYAHSVDILHRAATVLGEREDAAAYGELFENIRQAFQSRFVTADCRVGTGTQAAYVLALDFDLLDDPLRITAARRLADDVRSRGHLTTGLIATPGLLNVLSRFGYDEEAYALLQRREMPSWLYPISRGATTMWERWDGLRPDGSFQNPIMNSFNHCWQGSVGEWLYSVMAGIAVDPAAVGYKHILIRPRSGGGLSSVAASHLTPYGEVSVAWRIDRRFHLHVTIPANTTATVHLPCARLEEVLEADRSIAHCNDIGLRRQDGSTAVIEIGSGSYRFSYPLTTSGDRMANR
jgi:alpha-L-rhamnosidase